MSDFTSCMNDSFILLVGSRTVIAGNSNWNKLRDSSDTSEYAETFTIYGFFNAISLPTYVFPITFKESSCIYKICVNLKTDAESSVIKPNPSDHYVVSGVSNICIDEAFTAKKFRDFSNQKWGLFSTGSWSSVLWNGSRMYIWLYWLVSSEFY